MEDTQIPSTVGPVPMNFETLTCTLTNHEADEVLQAAVLIIHDPTGQKFVYLSEDDCDVLAGLLVKSGEQVRQIKAELARGPVDAEATGEPIGGEAQGTPSSPSSAELS